MSRSAVTESEVKRAGLYVVPHGEQEGLLREWKFLWGEPLDFYHAKFRQAGLEARSLPERHEIPLTRARELRADERARPPFGTHRVVTPKLAHEVTSWVDVDGEAFLIFYGPRDVQVRDNLFDRALDRIGVRSGDRFAHTTPGGLRAPGLWRSLSDLGAVELAVGLPSDDRTAADHLRMWQLLKPNCFLVTGGQLHRYLRVARETGLDPRKVFAGGRLILVDPAYQFAQARGRLEAELDAEVYVLAVVPEVPAMVAGECRYHNGLHVSGDYVYLEVCDPETGQEVPDGKRGHLVVTTVGLDSVWIRYDLEQYGYLDRSPCPCGEPGPRYVGLGKASRAVTVGGRVVSPIDVRAVLGGDFEPRFRLVERFPGTLGVDVESDMDTVDTADLGETLSRALDLPVDVCVREGLENVHE
jgi:phenylacetate-CoA ligase